MNHAMATKARALRPENEGKVIITGSEISSSLDEVISLLTAPGEVHGMSDGIVSVDAEGNQNVSGRICHNGLKHAIPNRISDIVNSALHEMVARKAEGKKKFFCFGTRDIYF